MPAVKAMGVMLSNPQRAQVSMNLTDFETTSLAAAWNAVGAEAAKRGVGVVESELIGLVPRAALEGAASELLRFAEFDARRVIENRVASVMASRPARFAGTLQPFLEALASDAPAPGGGSAAAAAGAMAAALGRMVTRLAGAKAAKAEPEKAPPAIWAEAGDEFAALTEALASSVDEDSEAFLAIRAALRLPKSTAQEQQTRRTAVEAATVIAAEIPLGVAARCQRVLIRLRELQPIVPPAMASDLTTALALAQAGASGARDNVAINLNSLPPTSPTRQRLADALTRLG